MLRIVRGSRPLFKKGTNKGLLVYFCACEAGLIHEKCDGVGLIGVLGYFIHNTYSCK